MKTIERDWDWWAYLWRVTHREEAGLRLWDERLADFVWTALRLQPGQRVLDVACGSGVHALELARRGAEVVGLDIAASLVAHATRQAADEDVQTVRYVQGDMRQIEYDAEFDAVTCLGWSFGFFDDQTNQAVLNRMVRALRSPEPAEGRPGGQVLLDLGEPISLAAWATRRVWLPLAGGYALHDLQYDPLTSTRSDHFVYLDSEGVLNTAAEPERIRVYTVPELKALFAQAGLTWQATYSDVHLPLRSLGPERHDRLVVVGRRPEDA